MDQNMNKKHTMSAAAVALVALVLTACGGGNGSPTGTVTMSLMDRPVDDVTELVVTIDAVRIKPRGEGPAVELPMTTTPMTVDLLSLNSNNAAVLVEEAVVEANDYNWVEFDIDDSDISKAYAMTVSGGMVPVDVDVPSDKLRLVSGFSVGPNQAVRFLFDWEVGKGLVNAVGRNEYILRPAFRILRVDELGAVSGKLTSATEMADPVCSVVDDPMIGKVVYFFAGAVTPDDIDGSDPEPVTTTDAVYDPGTGDYPFRAVLEPGDYTVALTCLGNEETESGNEDLMFLDPLGDSVITVTADTEIGDVDF
jgi:hypothetical protein